MTRPTFLIAGGQRCGTTSLWHTLNDHPEVYLAQPVTPEPKFFLPDNPESLADYEKRHFASAGNVKAVGEKSTSYLEVAGTAGRIAAAYPDIRIVFLLRHPVERAVSNYLFSVAHGFESRAAAAALAGQGEPAFDESQVRFVSPYSYIRRGLYAELLRPYQQEFPAEQLQILFFDDLVDDLAGLCQKLFEFLGVESEFRIPSPGTVANRGPEWTPMISDSTLETLIETFRESNTEIAKLTGRDLAAWNRASDRLLQCVF